jgi:hypothetical protein
VHHGLSIYMSDADAAFDDFRDRCKRSWSRHGQPPWRPRPSSLGN